MPLKNYGVLKGAAIGRVLGERRNPHYQVHLVDDEVHYRIAINVQSQLSPSELEYVVVEDFRHPITAGLPGLPLGFRELESRPGGLALDFIRGNLFSREQMKKLPFNVPGPDNDLNEKIDRHIGAAVADEDGAVYAFGERWGPEPRKMDKIFGFLPGNGIHDIHMNQGNVGQFRNDDGVYQDGGILIHHPLDDQWVAIFLKFQSQSWHTDDVHGHTVAGGSPGAGGAVTDTTPVGSAPGVAAHPGEPDLIVRIIAALVNPTGPDAGASETVTLLNTSPRRIDLTGWGIADKLKNKHRLSGAIDAGATRVVPLPATVQLGNSGGIITLLDAGGLKIDGVSYTQTQARRDGWTIVF